jgi:hypothetical protein
VNVCITHWWGAPLWVTPSLVTWLGWSLQICPWHIRFPIYKSSKLSVLAICEYFVSLKLFTYCMAISLQKGSISPLSVKISLSCLWALDLVSHLLLVRSSKELEDWKTSLDSLAACTWPWVWASRTSPNALSWIEQPFSPLCSFTLCISTLLFLCSIFIFMS